MNILQGFLDELNSWENIDENNENFTNLIPINEAIDILMRFEIAFINGINCEELIYLQSIEYGNQQIS